MSHEPPENQPGQGYQPPHPQDYDGLYSPQSQQGWEQQPAQGRPAGPPKPPRKRSPARVGCLSIIGLAVIIIVIVVIVQAVSGNNSNNTGAATGSGSNYVPPAAASPAPASAAATSPAAPQYTVSQQQAIAAAQGYLADGQGFSYAGLIQQLDSPDGNGFAVADATFAVNSLNVNWNQQAVIAAQGYMQSEPGWSACGLVQQLDSPDGSQFTEAQAEYAVQQVGLGSC